MNIVDIYGKPFTKKLKPTLGDQFIDNAIKQMVNPDRHEVGETVNEVWKKISREMDDAIRKCRMRGYRGIIYIQIKEKKLPKNMGTNGDLYSIVARKTRPTPEQASSLYTHRFLDEEPRFEYCLPELSWVEAIMRQKDSGKFTEKYINDIQAWIDGRLR